MLRFLGRYLDKHKNYNQHFIDMAHFTITANGDEITLQIDNNDWMYIKVNGETRVPPPYAHSFKNSVTFQAAYAPGTAGSVTSFPTTLLHKEGSSKGWKIELHTKTGEGPTAGECIVTGSATYHEDLACTPGDPRCGAGIYDFNAPHMRGTIANG